jgi:hypothetical protein
MQAAQVKHIIMDKITRHLLINGCGASSLTCL